MLGLEQCSLSVRVATVVVPAAVYFLLLGLLNSQRRPQLIAGRTDFVLLVVTFGPIFCVPVLEYFGPSVWTLVAVLGCLTAAAGLLAPPGWGNWVIYNVALPEVLAAAQRTLRQMDEPFRRRGRRLLLRRRDVTISLTALPLLKNVSLSATGPGARDFARDFQPLLGGQMASIEARPSPMAVTFLLIAVAMLVTPLGMVANRMPEMVRLLTGLVR